MHLHNGSRTLASGDKNKSLFPSPPPLSHTHSFLLSLTLSIHLTLSVHSFELWPLNLSANLAYIFVHH